MKTIILFLIVVLVGYGCIFRPLVIGPEQMPVITDLDQAKAVPLLALLSAVAHGRDDLDIAIPTATVACEAVRPFDEDGIYFDLIVACLGEAAGKAFQMTLRNYQYQSTPMRESYNKGKLEGQAVGQAAGQALAVLEVLDARGIHASDEQRQRIQTCTDLDTLKQWVRRAATVTSADELFV